MKKLFCAGLLSATAFPAFALGVTSVEISGGNFAWDYYYNLPQPLNAGPSNVISLPHDAPVGNHNNPIVYGSLFDSPFLGYVADSPPYESVPVTAEIVGASILIDFTGWVWDWNGMITKSGGIATGAATATQVPGLFSFNANWSATDMGGPTNGYTMTWTLAGTAQAVPEPATSTLLLSGIALVGGRKYLQNREKPKSAARAA